MTKRDALFPLGFHNIKQTINISDEQVECPVIGCECHVTRKKKESNNETDFKCPKHNIEITPTTFIYPQDVDNVIWRDEASIKLLEEIKGKKRESRIRNDRSEDALSWNVFQYLEKSKLIDKWLSIQSGQPQVMEDIIYWSYSVKDKDSWKRLNEAIETFGEDAKRGSEPDIIISTQTALFFVEAKFTSGNKTTGTGETLDKRLSNSKKYTTGANKWFDQVFTSKYEDILNDQKYELMRFWLLGSWIANQLQKEFYLINLVLDGQENNIQTDFFRHIRVNHSRRFIRTTWEDIFRLVANSSLKDEQTNRILFYMLNKSVGYKSGQRQKAFRLNYEVEL